MNETTRQQHQWRDLSSSGAGNDPVCERCGARRSQVPVDEQCKPQQPSPSSRVINDYDPFN